MLHLLVPSAISGAITENYERGDQHSEVIRNLGQFGSVKPSIDQSILHQYNMKL